MTTLQTNDYNQTVNAKTASYTLVASDVGTRITMNNASATTITVNTALFAAGDTLEIVNLGAGTCTITAGTATVNTAGSLALTQYESGVLYFNTTSAAVFFDYYQAQSAGAAGGTYISKPTSGSLYYAVSRSTGTAGGTQSSDLTTVSTTYYTPIIVSGVTATRIACRTGTSWTGVGVIMRLGIYNNDSTLNIPTTVLLDAGQVTPLAADSNYEITISQVLSAGLYWLAIKTNAYTSGVNKFTGQSFSNTAGSPLGVTYNTVSTALGGGSASVNTGWQETQAAGALATAGTLVFPGSTPPPTLAIGY
jgi:hypothetical protein